MEISNPAEVQAVSANIYNTLQHAVDTQIQQVGFVPDEQYGRGNGTAAALPPPPQGSSGNSYGGHSEQPNTPESSQEARWQCTEKQQNMILGQGRRCGMALAELDGLVQSNMTAVDYKSSAAKPNPEQAAYEGITNEHFHP